jgi:hypothetical protein
MHLSSNPNEPAGVRSYYRFVYRASSSVPRVIAAGVFFMFWALAAGLASASTIAYDVGDQALVRLFARSASVTVKTWDRSTVLVEWNDGDPLVPFKGTQLVASTTFPILAQEVREYQGPAGLVMALLPPEDFPVPGLALGLHDLVRVQEIAPPAGIDRPAAELSHVTLTIPASTRVLDVRIGRGDLAVSDYRGTTFAYVNQATAVNFVRVGGDAFVQALNGHFYAVDSNFNRLRVRSNHASLVFERCHIKEVDATSLTGNIVYDNGTFEAGLAHFSSDRGNVALGVSGSAQFAGHSQDGRVFSMQGTRTTAALNDTTAAFGSGGATVTASSNRGNVFFYDGSLADRRALDQPWRPMYGALMGERRANLNNLAMPKAPAAQTPRAQVDRRPRFR